MWYITMDVLFSANGFGMTVRLKNCVEHHPCCHSQSHDLVTLRCNQSEAGMQMQTVKMQPLCVSSDADDMRKPSRHTWTANVLHLAEAILGTCPNGNTLK